MHAYPSSKDQRSLLKSELKSGIFDLCIIGGGITGAGIALDAATRGMRVALLEKGDFASGTSSRSTKLIHGGLRYLKQFDFWLVKEVGSERSVVHKLAPHLVIPEKMLLPLIEQGSYGKWLTSVGLKVYDILAQVEGDDKRRMVDKQEALELEPLLPAGILKGAGYYAEYRTDDARLTLENIKTAAMHGAQVLNYARVRDLKYQGGQVSGVQVKDLVDGEVFEVRAKKVVNATGPWVDELRAKNKSLQGKKLFLTKGVHLVFPHEKLPVRQAVYFDVPDGRMIFAIPRGRVTYVGTTDTPFKRDKEQPVTDLADAMYLLTAVNNMFPDIELTLEDIESSWAGLRPLIHEEGKSASELSRKDEVFVSETGLISIAGGKLTGYRKMAERVVDRVVNFLEREEGLEFGACVTESTPLCGGPFGSYNDVRKYREELAGKLAPMGFDEQRASYLVSLYGRQAEEILKMTDQVEAEEAEQRLLLAELQFCLGKEYVQTPVDFLIRRTGRMYFDLPSVEKHYERVLLHIGQYFSLPEARINEWREVLKALIKEHADFSLDRDDLN